MTIKLHCFGESGNAYKAALALQLSGLDWEPVKVDFFGGETRTPEYRRDVNPMGEAPVMIDGDVRLTQSGVIQDYVSEKSGRFGGRNAEERREILRWVLWDNHKLSSMAGMTRFLMNFLPEDKQPKEVIAFHRRPVLGKTGLHLFVRLVANHGVEANRQRALGQSLGSFTHWIFAALLTLLFPSMVTWFAPGSVFAFFCFMMILQLVWVKLMVPETKGRPLENLEHGL